METLHYFYREFEFQLSGFDHQERKARRSKKGALSLKFSSSTYLNWLSTAGRLSFANWKVAAIFFNSAQ